MKRVVSCVAAAALTLTAGVHAGDPARSCEAGKIKEARKYGACRLKVEHRAVLQGGTPDFSKCETRFYQKWLRLEAQAGASGVCPTEDDEDIINQLIVAHTTALTTLLASGTPSDCTSDLATCSDDLNSCNDDLATCLSACPSGVLRTGQTSCYDSSGAAISCAGTGQDGESQKGIPRSFTDNGDGTVTDNATGLMWEKLSDDGSIHDKDSIYSWSDAFDSKIATLNATSFAGFDDWRVPNSFELLTLADSGVLAPSIDSAFNTNCSAGCTVLTCSCTASSFYWSSTSYFSSPAYAFGSLFGDGGVMDGYPKAGAHFVRAVRGGSE